MTDTPEDIRKKQFEIISSIPLKDRLNNLFEMTELSRRIIQNRIISKNPGISDIEMKVETFKIFYRFDFNDTTLDQIANSLKDYLDKNANKTSLQG